MPEVHGVVYLFDKFRQTINTLYFHIELYAFHMFTRVKIIP